MLHIHGLQKCSLPTFILMVGLLVDNVYYGWHLCLHVCILTFVNDGDVTSFAVLSTG